MTEKGGYITEDQGCNNIISRTKVYVQCYILPLSHLIKRVHRVQHDTTGACRIGKVAEHSNMLQYFAVPHILDIILLF